MDKVIRKVIPLDPDQWRRVEDYRFANRIPSEAAAIRQLIERGLGAETKPPAAGKKGNGNG